MKLASNLIFLKISTKSFLDSTTVSEVTHISMRVQSFTLIPLRILKWEFVLCICTKWRLWIERVYIMASFFRQIVKKRARSERERERDGFSWVKKLCYFSTRFDLLAFPLFNGHLGSFPFHSSSDRLQTDGRSGIFINIRQDRFWSPTVVLRHSISIPYFLFQVSRRTRQSFLDGSN